MKSVHQWFFEYGESHQNLFNRAIHKVAVPLIMVSILGLLEAIHIPWSNKMFSFAHLLALGAMLLYFRLSVSLAFGMLGITLAIFAGFYLMDGWLTWPIWAALFIIAWILQFVGHGIEGKKPSFFKDLQFLLIGPLWILAMVYQRLRIRY